MTTTEIAAAFLVQDSTMGQRISRAKRKIATAQIPYRVPEDHELPDRLPAVLEVLYLVFTTGHHATEGTLDSRVDLATEAIRLCRMLAELMPDEPEVRGLLALMLATHTRRHARLASDGSIVLLADQDRSVWDRAMIDEASELVEGSLRQRAAGEYRIQAAIACLHGLAPSYEETDFEQIAELYRLLEAVKPTPVVRVNRAVAEAQVAGPQRGLELLEGVTGLDAWHLFWATKADFHRRMDEKGAAAEAYRRALECQMNQTDRAFLEGRLASVV
jgi:RNA polymerase sigma-70 factor (ECF subfamily)